MKSLSSIVKTIIKFRDDRDWKQFHNPKDMALSLSLEAGEVMEHFQWKTDAEIESYAETHRAEIGHELADVLYWVLLLSHDLDIDILEALENKMRLNVQKYPVSSSRGKHDKYDKL